MDEKVLTERVERGAAWLDETRPGWWAEIDLATLDLADSCRCVLGQVFANHEQSGFAAALSQSSWYDVETGTDLVIERGFMAGGNRGLYTIGSVGSEYAALDELWIGQIKRRWEAGAS